MTREKEIKRIYRLLESRFGDLGWWPADTGFEVIVGAVLTQNTAWTNVEKAIAALKREKLLSPDRIEKAGVPRLSRVIRPAGYHRLKAGRLKEVSRFILGECGGRLGKLKKEDLSLLREKLLGVKGIGPETADSILLYAFNRPVFVVDAYTRRIFSRHGVADEGAPYEEIRSLVEGSFRGDTAGLNQFHALLVETGKKFCKKRKAFCEGCPLKKQLKGGRHDIRVIR